jgi:OFA family oxalate/formate antiporter-like MFS transporter
MIGALAIFGGFLMHTVVGSFYQWGIVNIYYTSYFKLTDPTNTLEKNAIVFPLMMFCVGLTMRLGLGFSELTHPLIALLVNYIIKSLTVLISSYMTTMWGFLAIYGIIFSLVNGLTFMIPMV